MGCLTVSTALDKGDLNITYDIDKGDLDLWWDMKPTMTIDVALICSVGDYDNVLFHVDGPLLVKDGYLLVQKT